MKAFTSIASLLVCLSSIFQLGAQDIDAELLKAKANTLQPIARIEPEVIDESSGIIKSKSYPDTYWTLNDSGGEAAIYPITIEGKGIQTDWEKSRMKPFTGIQIPNTVNIDWEDIALDGNGNLIIGAFGNNNNFRKDLAIYIVPEPDPRNAWMTRSLKTITFHYPDQKDFPPKKSLRNFDCEAVFTYQGKIYLLTKHRGNNKTKLYRFDRMEIGENNPLTLLDEFNLIDSMVTAADVSPDQSKLAVLTYKSVWIFEPGEEGSDDFFKGNIHWYPIKARQCEAICWDNNNELIITNEQRDIFKIYLKDFKKLR